MLRSMTGFGRCLVENAICIQQWEIKSVNGRHLDLKWRLPAGARCLEAPLEKIALAYVHRGRVEISLSLQFSANHTPTRIFDAAAATSMLEALSALAVARKDFFRPDYSVFLSMPALWSDPDYGEESGLTGILEEGLRLALEDWNESRSQEGLALGVDLQSRIMQMEEWTELIRERAPEIREERKRDLRARLEEALEGTGAELEDARFLQEIVILSDRIDASEELTRLSAHLGRLRQLLETGGDVGRKLDFTLQECFREINTCGNKLVDPWLSRVVVDFKNELERCREQVQNLE